MNDDKTQPPSGRGKRFLKLARLSASAATRYAGSKVKQAFQDESQSEASASKLYESLGQDMASTLGELKGAVMKVGQMASQSQGILPDEVVNALSVLQKDAPPMGFEVISKQIESALDGAIEILFASIDPEPYAAASIGQVHRATLHDGRNVVVKIQYPGVKKSVSSDIAQLKMLLKASRLIKVDKKIADAYFREIKKHILEELDYKREAKNLKAFKAYHVAHDEQVIIPEVIDELSGDTVLTMTYEWGDHSSSLKQKGYDQVTINALGYRIFNTIMREIFDFGQVHGDPHPGNFAFRPDGSLVVYDFGSIKKLDSHIVRCYRDLLKAAFKKNYRQLDRVLDEMGGRVPNSPEVEDEYYAVWVDILLSPFISDEPFDFARSDLHERVKQHMSQAFKRMDSLQPVVGTAFIDRAISGHYNTMMTLGVNASFKQDFLKILNG